MEPIYINTAIAALGYAVAASLSKHALELGAGILRLSFMTNWLFLPVFALLLIDREFTYPLPHLGYPVLTGFFFFFGQIFTFAAIRLGDVSLQTPVMGTKAVFVVVIALTLGTESITKSMLWAAVASMLGVALLGFSGAGVKRVGVTLGLALLSSLFFAASDTMMGFYGGQFDAKMYMFIMVIVNALLSLLLMPFFQEPLRAIPNLAWIWIVSSGLLMAGQALLLNYTLTRYQNVAAVNVVYSTRGLWSVVIGLLLVRYLNLPVKLDHGRIQLMRLSGAALMCLAIAILFTPWPM